MKRFYSLFSLGWRGKLFSLVIAVLIYMYYLSAIRTELSFVLPLKTNSTKNTVVQFLDENEAVLYLSGRSDDLENLRSSDFEVYVELDSKQSEAQKLPVQYRLRNSNLQLSGKLKIRVEPTTVRVLVEKEVSKELSVKVSIDGYPDTGYSLETYQASPKSISVTGPHSVLEKLDSVSTKMIDITGRNASYEQVVPLQFANALSTEERASLQMSVPQVQVDIQINAKKETQSLAVSPQLLNLPEGLELSNIIPQNVQVTLQGNSDLLEKILRGELELKIELDGGDIFTSGRYSLPIQVSTLPEGVNLLSSIPNRVSVVVENR